ncbi:MAG: tRNA (adenosine(37)-N6)-threonylcarbamoyltransferase complex ATPase subunit type 1 TsaE [Bryobacterales bacterium]|jgi:tRNA threonylcarbamoyladenosine biosynthesis protein TsaE|nr:tRNA (adenosine(37)-N6)-threonylcarbamoyltransferase complex ATPase subunit type 1 TsaE [Bryobacterales bacterium]
MPSRVFEAESEEAMVALGQRLAPALANRVVLLIGNLGAGKTTLAKGIASGLGAAAPEDVSSPTFTLVHEYGEPVSVYHIDLYRLDEEGEAASLGLDEIFDRRATILVEWGERFPKLMPPRRVEVRIAQQGDGRRVEVQEIE